MCALVRRPYRYVVVGAEAITGLMGARNEEGSPMVQYYEDRVRAVVLLRA